MKELLLQATLSAGSGAARPSDICQWLLSLMKFPSDSDGADAPRLCHAPCAEVLEVWLKNDSSPRVAGYSRIAFRPLPRPQDGGRPAAGGGVCRQVAVELLPAMQVYTAAPLSEMGLVGATPQLITMQGWVVPYDSLGPRQFARLGSSYAVLTGPLAACLGLPFGVERRARAACGPYENLRQELERLLRLCFPAGGEADGCPLHLSLQPADVPACRLLRVGGEHRQFLFGEGGVELSPRRGIEQYGAYLPSPHTWLTVVMLYPRGELDAARRLFGLLFPLCGLISAVPRGAVEEWIAYDADERAPASLTYALYTHPQTEASAASRLYCYLTPSGPAAAVLERGWCAVRLRRLIHSFGSLFMGPVPLHAIRPEVWDRYLPSVAARLLVRLGGVPWVPFRWVGQEEDLVAGYSHSRPGQAGEPICAGAFYTEPAQFCRPALCRPAERFPLFFGRAFRLAYEQFYTGHGGCPPRRLVVYCHADLPIEPLLEFADWMGGCAAAIPVVLAQVRRMAAAELRHYDPDAPGGMPPAGTCLRCGDDRFLLFCRDFLSPSETFRGFYPTPLELTLKMPGPGGEMFSPDAADVDALLAQTCQWVWAGVDGSPLPLLLGHTDRMVRCCCREWQAERAARMDIGGGAGNVTF